MSTETAVQHKSYLLQTLRPIRADIHSASCTPRDRQESAAAMPAVKAGSKVSDASLKPQPRKLAPAGSIAMASSSVKPRPLRPLRPLVAAGTRASGDGVSPKVLTNSMRIARAPAASSRNPIDEYDRLQETSEMLTSKLPSTSPGSSTLKNSQNKYAQADRSSLAESSASASTRQSPPSLAHSPASLASSSTGEADAERDSAEPSTSSKAGEVQVKKEWVLPARAKPGRKPSDIEPPTKRKAQNRASQRAFRERRQSYLASLEAKIAEYEQRGATASLELQRAARRLKEENESLRAENAKLKSLLGEMENSRRPKTVNEDLRSAHTRSTQEGNRQDGGDCGFCTREECVCLGEGVLQFPEEEDAGSNDRSSHTRTVNTSLFEDHVQKAVPLKRPRLGGNRKLWFTIPNAMALPPPLPRTSSMVNGSGHLPTLHNYAFPAKQQAPVQVCPTVSRDRWPTLHRISRQLPPLTTTTLRSGDSVSYPHANTPRGRADPMGQSIATRFPASEVNAAAKVSSQSSASRTSIWPVYASSQASHSQRIPSHSPESIRPKATFFRMRRQAERTATNSKSLVCSGDPDNCMACSTDPALAAFCKAVSSHLQQNGSSAIHQGPVILDTGNALPLRRRLTFVKDAASSQAPTLKRLRDGTHVELARNEEASTRPRLWSISSDRGGSNAAETLAMGHVHSLSRQLPSSHSLSTIKRAPTIESIPEAWRRIKQHPSFGNWQGQQGGLDLLADVVARRSSPPSSNDEEMADMTKTWRSMYVPQPNKSQASQHGHGLAHRDTRRVRIAESGTRNDTSEASDTRDGIANDTVQEDSSDGDASDPDDCSDTPRRRRLYVERRSVDTVLAMMDQGRPQAASSDLIPSSSRNAFTQPEKAQSAQEDDGIACACPLSKLM